PIPLVTCFSGRDGFRSTRLSLSAPLEVITGCNTAEWTLLTVTHEISHTIVEGVLSALLRPENPETLAPIIQGKSSGSLFERVVEMLAWAHWAFEEKSEGTLSLDKFSSLVLAHAGEVNEILTHVFDFLYFYQGNANSYIKVCPARA